MDSYNTNGIISPSNLSHAAMVNYSYLGLEDLLESEPVSLQTGIDLTKSLSSTNVASKVDTIFSTQNEPISLTASESPSQVCNKVSNEKLSGSLRNQKGNTHAEMPTKSNKKSICPQCGKMITAGSENLAQHLRTHTGEKPFGCTECGAHFAAKSSLRTHLRLHTGERPYMCAVCGKKFIQSSHLPIHMRVHTGEKPYECEKCNRKFSTKNGHDNHVKIHKGELDFKCDICSQRFLCNAWLQGHLKVHSLEKPFECDKCGKKFKDKSYVMKHKQEFCGNDGYKRRWKVPGVAKPKGRPPKRRKVNQSVGRPRGFCIKKYKGKKKLTILKKISERNMKENADNSKSSMENPQIMASEDKQTSDCNELNSKNLSLEKNSSILPELDPKPIYLGSGSNLVQNSHVEQQSGLAGIEKVIQNEESHTTLMCQEPRTNILNNVGMSDCSRAVLKTMSTAETYLDNQSASVNCPELSGNMGVVSQMNIAHQSSSLLASTYILNLAQPENLSLHNFNTASNIELPNSNIFNTLSQRSPQNLSHAQQPTNNDDNRFTTHFQNMNYTNQSHFGQNLSLRCDPCEPQNLSQTDHNDDFCSLFSQPQNLSLHENITQNNLQHNQVLAPQTNMMSLTNLQQPENLSLPENLSIAQNIVEPQNLSLPQNLSQPQNLSINHSISSSNFSQTHEGNMQQPQNLSRSLETSLLQPCNLSQPYNLSQPQNLSSIPQSNPQTSTTNSIKSQPQNLSLVQSVMTPNKNHQQNNNMQQPQNLSYENVNRTFLPHQTLQNVTEPQNLSVSQSNVDSNSNSTTFSQPQNLSLSHLPMSFSTPMNQLTNNQSLHVVYYS